MASGLVSEWMSGLESMSASASASALLWPSASALG
jgi:hypothetical protein